MFEIHARHVLTPDGWAKNICIEISNGKISKISKSAASDQASIDLLLPAPVNLHSHAFQRAMAGLTEKRGLELSDTFWTWRQLMYHFLDQLTPEHVKAIAELVFMEMLEAGYGAVAEFHYLHHNINGMPYHNLSEMAESVVSAAQDAGIGLTLLPVLYMHGGCDKRSLQGGQRRFGCDWDLFCNLHNESSNAVFRAHDDYKIGVAPHSLRAVTPEALAKVSQICSTGPIHMHLAEQKAEVIEVKAHLGARPVEWLLANANLSAEWCLIHCTQMTENETKRLAATDAVVGLCPITESNLGDGIFNGITFQDAGGRFGVGSDSNIHITLWGELATLDYSQRLRDSSRAAMATPNRSTGRYLFDTAVLTGAQAASRPSGEIVEGNLADLVAVSTDNEFLCNRVGDAVLDSLIFTGHGSDCVTDVWSAGRHMVVGGRHIHRKRIVKKFIEVSKKLGQEL